MNPFRRKTPEEAIRESKRDIRRGQRDIDRDIRDLERQEKQLIVEIKALARKGDNKSARVQTKSLIAVRKQKENLMMSKGRLGSVAVQQTTMKANLTVQKAMGGAAKAMSASNKQMDPQKLQATLMQFEKQQQLASMSEEYFCRLVAWPGFLAWFVLTKAMLRMMDDMLADEFEEEESDQVLGQVLDEIGLDLGATLSARNVPDTSLEQQKTTASEEDAALEAEMKRLLGS